MKCCNCKYYSYSSDFNACSRLKFEYFHPFYEEECDCINDDYSENEEEIKNYSV